MKRKNLKDLTFIFPVRLDSVDRLENIILTTNYLLTLFDTHIIVFEAFERNNGILSKLLDKRINYIYKEDYDPIFYRTKYINTITSICETPFVAIWDTDVIAPQDQIIKSIILLRNNKADFVYPYKDIMLNVPSFVKNIFIKSYEISILQKYSSAFLPMYLPKSVGGGFLANKIKYIEAGMENENFYGWGPEDIERFERWNKLKYKIKKVNGVLFHFSHNRGINSSYHNINQYSIKFKEINKIRNQSEDKIKSELFKRKLNI